MVLGLGCLHRKQGGDRPLYLRSYVSIGRWEGSHVVIPRSGVSQQHASIQWVGSHWILRDLGSRNGTLHNGARIETSESRTLTRGDEIVFGERDEIWIVGDVDPPGLLLAPAEAPITDAIHVAADEAFFALPSRDDPQVTIVHHPDGTWSLEGASDDVVPLGAGAVVSILDRRYEVVLPNRTQETSDPAAPLVEQGAEQARFEIEVSSDEETAAVTMMVDNWDRPRRAKESVPLYLFAYLARCRCEHAATGSSLEGWLEIETACRALRLTREQLGLHVFRVRECLRELGLVQAAIVIERRKGWIRTAIEPARLQIVRTG